MTHQTTQARFLFATESASFAVVAGVGHIYNEERPTNSWVPPYINVSKIVPCEISQNRAFVVHVRSQKPVAHLLKVFGETTGLNASHTAFKVVFKNKPHPCLACGYLMVGRAFAEIRPFLPEDVWAKTPHVTTLLLRGPNSEDEIFEWWPALKEKQAAVYRQGKTWFIKSSFRKHAAPERSGPRSSWKLVASGHCFSCGHAGHSEASCPCHRSRCRLCGSSTHTAEVCPAPAKKISPNVASKKLGTIKKALKLVKDRHWDVPPALCRLIAEAAAEASEILKNPGRRPLNIIRPNQQKSSVPPPPATSPIKAGAAAASGGASEVPVHASAAAASSAAASPGPQAHSDLPPSQTTADDGSVSHPSASSPSPAAEAAEAPAVPSGSDSASDEVAQRDGVPTTPQMAAVAAAASPESFSPATPEPVTPELTKGGKRPRPDSTGKESTQKQTSIKRFVTTATPLSASSRVIQLKASQGKRKRKKNTLSSPPKKLRKSESGTRKGSKNKRK